jgi:adenylate kinase family enzyme
MTAGAARAERIAVIGNSGGGKSRLARRLAARLGLPFVEVDALLWRPGWVLAPQESYDSDHERAIAGEAWVIDGLGRRASIPGRLARATRIVLVDMPLWMHFWLAAERQIAWSTGPIADAPAGAQTMPPTEALFRTISEVDRDWMPEIRRLVDDEEVRGKRVERLRSLADLDACAAGRFA